VIDCEPRSEKFLADPLRECPAGQVQNRFRESVESGCDAVTLGSGCLLPPLSSGGARVPSPSLRFHTHRVARGLSPRLPQNVACRFPALRSSVVDSQHSIGLEPPVRQIDLWTL
jgi:hypothetical protein